jgi:hypothetical protein
MFKSQKKKRKKRKKERPCSPAAHINLADRCYLRSPRSHICCMTFNVSPYKKKKIISCSFIYMPLDSWGIYIYPCDIAGSNSTKSTPPAPLPRKKKSLQKEVQSPFFKSLMTFRTTRYTNLKWLHSFLGWDVIIFLCYERTQDK